MSVAIAPDSLVTLHYRIALGDGTEIISTFESTPATLKLGCGELAPSLERCLADVGVGERHVFLLEPQQAFGPHRPELVGRVPRADLPEKLVLEEMAMIEFSAPGGATVAGLVRAIEDDAVLMDFNHPLAGKDVRFEVEVIGVL
ncbi:MAG: FKBP-type peptidyl-prolyl cis-trans isomerase [Betaproteobacteria bacterium]|nr:FKBP-type peptidyl-prolyl cis-trans isomerase [Betaproteobacteria bacterium]